MNKQDRIEKYKEFTYSLYWACKSGIKFSAGGIAAQHSVGAISPTILERQGIISPIEKKRRDWLGPVPDKAMAIKLLAGIAEYNKSKKAEKQSKPVVNVTIRKPEPEPVQETMPFEHVLIHPGQLEYLADRIIDKIYERKALLAKKMGVPIND